MIAFDIFDGEANIQFLDKRHDSQKMQSDFTAGMTTKEDPKERIRMKVEGKIHRHGDHVRETVREYLRIISVYDSGFQKICTILENRLRGYGFNTEDILELQVSAFLNIYESTEQPADYEIIVRNDTLFAPVGFRAIEKYLRSAIIRDFSLQYIYQCIRVLLKRPMVRDEAIVISQHIHRMLQAKMTPGNK